jgi:hypothetical protein
MSDIKKIGLGGGKGKKGERGERGHRGPAGPAVAGGAIVIDGTDPDTRLIAGEDGSPGSPIYADPNTAFLASNDTAQHAQVLGLLGPAGMTNAIAVPTWTVAGALVLASSAWDAITGGSGGLISGAAYYVDSTPGRLTTTKPTDDDVFVQKVGVAITNVAMNVQVGAGPFADVAPPPPPGSARVSFCAGLEFTTDGLATLILPYCPAPDVNGDIAVISPGPTGPVAFGIGFGASVESSPADAICWASPIPGTLSTLQVNVSSIADASVDFSIRLSPACNGPFSPVLEINGITAAGCYQTAGAIPISPGDRISFRANVTKLV